MIDHSDNCTGCPTCNEDLRLAFRAFALADYDTYEKNLRRFHARRGMRTASGGDFVLRTGIHYPEDTMTPDDQTLTIAIANALRDLGVPVTRQKTERGLRIAKRVLEGERGADIRSLSEFESPDPYQQGLADLRAAEASVAAARSRQPTPRATKAPLDHNGVPDPYAEGLKALRAQEHR